METHCQLGPDGNCTKCGKSMACPVPPLRRRCDTSKPAPISLDCPSRGLVVRSERVEACCGKVRKVKVFACGLRLAVDGMSGECSIEKVDGVRNCEACIRAGEHERK